MKTNVLSITLEICVCSTICAIPTLAFALATTVLLKSVAPEFLTALNAKELMGAVMIQCRAGVRSARPNCARPTHSSAICPLCRPRRVWRIRRVVPAPMLGVCGLDRPSVLLLARQIKDVCTVRVHATLELQQDVAPSYTVGTASDRAATGTTSTANGFVRHSVRVPTVSLRTKRVVTEAVVTSKGLRNALLELGGAPFRALSLTLVVLII